MPMDDDALLGILPGTTINVDPSSAWPIAGDTGIAQGTGTGQHGIVPTITEGTLSSIADAWSRLWDWFHAPLTQPVSMYSVALMAFALALGWFVWGFMLYHVRIAAESI